MAFRDDNEALQAKVGGLEKDLAEAKATIDDLQGVADFARPDLLPKRSRGRKRRVRTINGPVGAEAYDRIAKVLQSAGEVMDTSLVGRTFIAKSKGLEVTVLPGEGDELLMVFDEAPSMNYFYVIFFFVFFSFAALGAAQDNDSDLGVFMFVFGALMTSFALYFAKQKGKQVQTERKELFASVGGLLQRSTLKTRVAEHEDAAVEMLVDDDIPLENEA